MAVIGGGASAVLFLAHLFREVKEFLPAEISVFERTGRFGRGIAYATSNPDHLLNVRAREMSALERDPDHFARWLEGKYPYSSLDFVPRMVYGDYLEDLFSQTLRAAEEAGCSVFLKTETIKERPEADIVIAATGNAIPVSPAGANEVSSGDGYHDNPWTVDYKAVQDRVLILGTGLSMVDAVLSLRRAGFKGRIMAVSRHGLLPAVHAPPARYDLETGWMPQSVLGFLCFIRAQIRMAAKEGTPWQAVIDSFRPYTNRIWLSLPSSEKKKFLRLAPFWNIHRHRMAPRVAQMLGEMNIEILKDRIIGIRRDAKALSAQGLRATYAADHVINCLGYRNSGSLGEGPGVYALGPAQTGLLETTAIPEIREQASAVAAALNHRSRNGEIYGK